MQHLINFYFSFLINIHYYSVQTLLFSRLASKNLKIKICKTMIFSAVQCDCETWSLKLREERRLMVFENRIRRQVFGPSKNERRIHSDEFHKFLSFTQYIQDESIWIVIECEVL